MPQRFRLSVIAASLAALAVMMLWVRRYSVSPRDLHALAAQLRWWPFPLILALLAGHVALAAARWSRIEEALGGSKPSFGRAFSVGAIALGVGTVMPGPLTNIAARALSNSLGGQGTIRGAVSGAVDQFADLAIVALFVPAGILGMATGRLDFYLFGVAVTGLLAFGGLILAPFFVGFVARFTVVRQIPFAAERLITGRVLILVYFLSLLRFGCLTAITVLIHSATGAATLSAAVIAVPLVTVAISLAMLPGGLGVSEWSFSAVFTAMGVAHGQIVIFVLGNRIVLTLAALVLMALALGRSALRMLHAGAIAGAAKVGI